MKKNGFMVVECIVASVIVITAIVLLYTQVKSVSRSYNSSFNYDNITSMYTLANFRTFLMNDDNFNRLETSLNTNYSCTEVDCTKCYVYVDCSIFLDGNVNYCDRLLTASGITTSTARPRQIIFVKENVTNLKSCVKETNGTLKNSFVDYIQTIKTEDNKRYLLIASFDDGTNASLVVYRASGV